MDDVMTILGEIRELAERNMQAEKKIKGLENQFIDCKKKTKDLKETNRKSNLPEYLIGAVILDYLCGYALFLFSGKSEIDNILCLMCGMALIVIWLPVDIVAVKLINKRISRKNAVDNQSTSKENAKIAEENANIDNINDNITDQLVVWENERMHVLNKLQEIAPWFPESYLYPKKVDYITNLIRTGKADTIGQAIIYYETNR